MSVKFGYNTNLKIKQLKKVLDDDYFDDFFDDLDLDDAVITSHTSNKIVYRDDENTTTIIGSNLKSLKSSTIIVSKIITKDNSNGETKTIEGNLKYKLDSRGNDKFEGGYITKLIKVIPYEGKKLMTLNISADKINLNNKEMATSDIKNYKYELFDGVGGKISFSIPLLKAYDYNKISNGDLSIKQQIEYFNSSKFLSGNDTISIANSTELFLNKKGIPELNGYGGNDILTGSKLSDILNGGTGADKLIGGLGNDTYIVDNVKDTVIESLSQGNDTVQSSVTYTLSTNVENITLTGILAINGTGNNLNNTLNGNNANNVLNGKAGNDVLNGQAGNDILYGESGNDTLNGGVGLDTLFGGIGADKFVFNTTLNSVTNKDVIKDFNAKDDTILLENAIFKKLTSTGTLKADFFKVTTDGKAKDSNDFIVYNKSNGQLFYDADGSGKGASVLFATLENKVNITNADFVVI